MSTQKNGWDWEINSKVSIWGFELHETWAYRNLLTSFVKRDFLVLYQQTILGPLWILVSPILTLVVYVLVFGKMMHVNTGSTPPVLFYFSGIVLWNCFIDIFSGTSNTLKDNYYLFSKVYFPRIIVPISVTGTQLLRVLIQVVLLVMLIGYYSIFKGLAFTFSIWSLTFPFALFSVAIVALGIGLIFSVVTAKYRDLGNLVVIAIRLLMFVTPVFYPVETISEKYRWIIQINPLTPLFELFRFSMFGQGNFTISQLVYSLIFMIATFIGSVFIFNKQCDKLIDVI